MIVLIRIFFIASCAVFGFYSPLLWLGSLNLPQVPWAGAVLGLLAGCFVLLIDVFFKKYTVRNILAVLLGAALGLLTHRLFMMVIHNFNLPPETERQFGIATAIVFTYLGVITMLRGQDEFTLMIPFVTLDTKASGEELILLDTSVIIDGRIADICETHFLSGKLVLPRFVLKELQLIADSSDPLKRNRGRRGLDVLNRVKSNPNVQVKINEMDFPEFSTVDAKLVKMGQVLNAKVFTNDFNLNKVAELQGVKVLNINELANALKPIVMPGEVMQVKILKEGKEHDQGVAYLDDGTMVVVDNGRKRMGQTLNVTITSVLQTQAGRMIFAKPGDDYDRGDSPDRNRGNRDRGNRDRNFRPPFRSNQNANPNTGPGSTQNSIPAAPASAEFKEHGGGSA
ncbi:MAG: TRAM domain-containing protein [Candidatus Omnitrophica bacterium]|nr:TRAM domain-containing protein [Candidatus Omnitrophota bacterium]